MNGVAKDIVVRLAVAFARQRKSDLDLVMLKNSLRANPSFAGKIKGSRLLSVLIQKS